MNLEQRVDQLEKKGKRLQLTVLVLAVALVMRVRSSIPILTLMRVKSIFSILIRMLGLMSCRRCRLRGLKGQRSDVWCRCGRRLGGCRPQCRCGCRTRP